MELINLTPHAVTVIAGEKAATYPTTGVVARLIENREASESINDFPSCYISFGRIDGLPEPKDGTMYIVSALVGPIAAAQGRHDIVSPDSGRAIREDGRIIGVPGFVRY